MVLPTHECSYSIPWVISLTEKYYSILYILWLLFHSNICVKSIELNWGIESIKMNIALVYIVLWHSFIHSFIHAFIHFLLLIPSGVAGVGAGAYLNILGWRWSTPWRRCQFSQGWHIETNNHPHSHSNLQAI